MEIVQLADVFNNVNNITVNATKLVNDLDEQVLVLSKNANQLIKNLNDVVSPENKEHFGSVLANADGMLKESRPHMEKTLANLDTVSGKMTPTIDNLNVTMGKANNLTDHLDGVVVENRKEIHDTLVRLQTSLAEAERMINDLDDTLGANRGNLDETLENIRATSENLKEFTDTAQAASLQPDPHQDGKGPRAARGEVGSRQWQSGVGRRQIGKSKVKRQSAKVKRQDPEHLHFCLLTFALCLLTCFCGSTALCYLHRFSAYCPLPTAHCHCLLLRPDSFRRGLRGDGEPVGAHAVPFLDEQALLLKESADAMWRPSRRFPPGWGR